jgi:hypothetical protein
MVELFTHQPRWEEGKPEGKKKSAGQMGVVRSAATKLTAIVTALGLGFGEWMVW